MDEYSLIWVPMPAENNFVVALGAKQNIHLPFFLFGDDLTSFKKGKGVNSNFETLLYGILYGVSDNAPTVNKELSLKYFPKAIEILTSELEMLDEETLIITAGANIRQKFGSAISARILENGISFVPKSSKIKSDLIVDIWVASENSDEPKYIDVLKKIVSILKEINFASISPDVRKTLCYIATVAFNEVEPKSLVHFMETNFTESDRQWPIRQKNQISDYLESKRFSWEALTLLK